MKPNLKKIKICVLSLLSLNLSRLVTFLTYRGVTEMMIHEFWEQVIKSAAASTLLTNWSTNLLYKNLN